MESCEYCQTIIQIMRKQIVELSQRQEQLNRVNSALMEALAQSVPTSEQNAWKHKYQAQLQRSFKLQKQIIQLKMSKKSQRSHKHSDNELFTNNQNMDVSQLFSFRRNKSKTRELNRVESCDIGQRRLKSQTKKQFFKQDTIYSQQKGFNNTLRQRQHSVKKMDILMDTILNRKTSHLPKKATLTINFLSQNFPSRPYNPYSLQ